MVVKGMEGGIACHQAVAKEFTPITVSADFGALARLASINSQVATTVTQSANGDCTVAKAA